MRLRTVRPEDAAALAALVTDAFRDYMAGIGRDWPAPGDWLAERLAAGAVEVAEEEAQTRGALPGMIALTRDGAAGTLTVDLLAVAPAAQGRGIGRQLLAHAEAIARAEGAGELSLHTVAKYDRLVRLYERAGFAVTHHGPRPKGDDGHPRAFLRKELATEGTQA